MFGTVCAMKEKKKHNKGKVQDRCFGSFLVIACMKLCFLASFVCWRIILTIVLFIDGEG